MMRFLQFDDIAQRQWIEIDNQFEAMVQILIDNRREINRILGHGNIYNYFTSFQKFLLSHSGPLKSKVNTVLSFIKNMTLDHRNELVSCHT